MGCTQGVDAVQVDVSNTPGACGMSGHCWATRRDARMVSKWLACRFSAVASWILAIAINLCGANLLCAEEAVATAWLNHARVAGAELFVEMTDAEIAENLSNHVAQKVTVVEADSDLSRLLTDREFEGECGLLRRYSQAAHRLGIKVVWYYPALEVLSPKARQGHTSMYKMHPS